MDTRTKIIGPAEALASWDGCKVVTGYFDPLTAAHAARLSELAAGGKLWVVVCEPERPLLSQRARAELVAGLGVVERVVAGAGTGWLDSLPPGVLVREEAADTRWTSEFVARVRARQAAG